MLGGDDIGVIDSPTPLSELFSDPRCLTPSDGLFYIWWIHPADYEPVVRMLKELGAARRRARPLRVGEPIARHGRNNLKDGCTQGTNLIAATTIPKKREQIRLLKKSAV
jgi:hypothetical protein